MYTNKHLIISKTSSVLTAIENISSAMAGLVILISPVALLTLGASFLFPFVATLATLFIAGATCSILRMPFDHKLNKDEAKASNSRLSKSFIFKKQLRKYLCNVLQSSIFCI